MFFEYIVDENKNIKKLFRYNKNVKNYIKLK